MRNKNIIEPINPQCVQTSVKHSTAVQDIWKCVRENTNDFNFLTYRLLRNEIYPKLQKEKEDIITAFLKGKMFSDGLNYAPNVSRDIAEKWFLDKYGY
jgi:hypothetical protein